MRRRKISVPPKKQGWIRRLVGYMKPHKKHAYIAFGVAIGGQLLMSLIPLVQKVIVDDVITTHEPAARAVVGAHDRDGRGRVRVRLLPAFPRRSYRARRAARPPDDDLPSAPASRLREPRRAPDRPARQPGVFRRRVDPGLLAIPPDRRRQHPVVPRVAHRDVHSFAAARAHHARGRAGAPLHRAQAAHVRLSRRAGIRNSARARLPTSSRRTSPACAS